VLGVGWSHKYEALLSDYQQTERLLRVDTSPADIRSKLDALAVSAGATDDLASLQSAAQKQKQDSRTMWASVRTTTGL
jgi:hypothetical protein